MAWDAIKNAAYSLVATAPSPPSSGTSLVVTAGEGARFPAAPFNITVWAAGAQPLFGAGGATGGNFEIIRVGAISGDTLSSLTRAQEGTTARTILVGDQIAETITAKTITDIQNAAMGGDLSGTFPNPEIAVGLDTIAGDNPTGADWSNNSNKITSVKDPTGAQDAATKNYVDTQFSAVNPAVAVTLATTAAGDTSALTYNNGVSGIGATLTGAVNTALTIDGVTLTAVGQRVLVKNDTQSPSGAFNGIYQLTQLQTGLLAPVLTRALDYDQTSDINSTGAIPVISGTANAGTSWLLTSSVATVGTSPLTYTQFSYAATATANAVLTTTGDLVYASAPNVLARRAVGSSGQFLSGGTTPSYAFPPGHEFDYVEFTSTVNITASTEATATTIVTGNAVTYDGSTIILIEFFAPILDAQSNSPITRFVLFDGSTSLGWLTNIVGANFGDTNFQPLSLSRRLTPSAAAHTYKIGAFNNGAGKTMNCIAGAGGVGVVVPGYIRITKV